MNGMKAKAGQALVGTPAVIDRERRQKSTFGRLLEEYKARGRVDLLTDFLVAVAAFLLAQTHALFGVYPFAVAFLCALRRHLLVGVLGAVLGSLLLGEAGVLYLVIYISVFLLRLVFSAVAPRFFESAGLFDEHPLFRVLEACLVGCLMAAYELALFGIYDYTVLFALGAVLLPSVFTLLFAALMETGISLAAAIGKEPYALPASSRTGASGLFLQLGGLSLLFALVLSLRSTVFYGVSLARCATTLFTLLISRRFGGMRGCAAGLVLALAGEAVYIPVFGLLGLLSGLYSAIGVPCALAAAVIAGGAYAVYVEGLSGFLEVVPELSVTSVLAWPFLRTITPADVGFFEKKQEQTEEASAADGQNEVANAYRSIARVLYDISEKEKRPAPEALGTLCGQIQTATCRTCSARSRCKEELAVRTSLATGKDMWVSCENMQKMRDALARECAVLSERQHLGGTKGAFSAEYALHARLLEELERRRREEEEEDVLLSKTLKARLAENGISVARASVLGKRTRRVVLSGVRQKGGAAGAARLREICVEVCGSWLSDAAVSGYGRAATYVFESERKYAARTVTATKARTEKEPSGDRTECFSDEGGVAYILLSDGMGSGASAASAAGLCVSVLSSLLRVGVEPKTALELADNLLCAENEECSVALDMLSIDLCASAASFIKSGAAASFVRRGDSLYRIRAKTIPMGVLREVDAEEIHFDIEEGDLFILLSDGVMQGNEDGGWLKEHLRRCEGLPLEQLAKSILAAAANHTEEGADDMTVALTQIVREGVEVQSA